MLIVVRHYRHMCIFLLSVQLQYKHSFLSHKELTAFSNGNQKKITNSLKFHMHICDLVAMFYMISSVYFCSGKTKPRSYWGYDIERDQRFF